MFRIRVPRMKQTSIVQTLRYAFQGCIAAGRSGTALCLAVTFLVLLAADPNVAIAQATDAPPQPVLRQSPPQWLGLGIMFILFVIVLFLSLMSSKRSHQE